MPFLLLIAGRGLDLVGKVAGGVVSGSDYASRLRWAVPAAIFAVGTLYALTQSIPYWANSYKDYNGISAEPLQAAERANLKNALIFVQLDPSKSNRDYGKVFPANDPLLRGDRVYVRDLGPQRNKGLLGYFPGRQPYYLPLEGPPRPGVGP